MKSQAGSLDVTLSQGPAKNNFITINCNYDRNYWIPEHKVDSIYRILCLRDSMLLGCGVMQDEILPAHLNYKILYF